MLRTPKYIAGFTLIEAVMVMVITGALAALIVSFAAPLRGYFDATARADLSDVADTALRRMARELHGALPNSVRGGGSYIEFLPTITGGRYRKEQDCSAPPCVGDPLDFTAVDTSFDVIGILPAVPAAGNELVIYNTTPTSVYSAANVATLTAAAGASCALSTTQMCFSAGMKFPFASPSQRFQIIGKPITYACSGTTLWRYSGYSRQAAQPITIATLDGLAGVTKARLATGVNCASSSFVYTSGVTNRADLVVMSLTLVNNSNDSAAVSLLHQVHVQNVP